MKHPLFILALLIQQILCAQKEGNIWYFGENAGIDFNSGAPVALTNGVLNTTEGCSSICDSNGALLFYTDGVTIWDKNHQSMTNGTGLTGSSTSTQSAIIVKKPGSNSIYFVFTVDYEAHFFGLCYSEVDMSLYSGLGGINANKSIKLDSPTCEKIAAIKHQNGKYFWIVTKLYNSNVFHSYLLTETGLNTTPIISQVGTVVNTAEGTIGYLRASANGDRIACANFESNEVNIFNFNRQLGSLSKWISLTGFSALGAYGLEFSPNNKYLYVTEGHGNCTLNQFDLSAGSYSAIQNSRVVLSTELMLGALLLGPDQKIYLAKQNGYYLGVINNPNQLGNASNYVQDGFYLDAKKSKSGLPTLYVAYGDTTSVKDTTFLEVNFAMPNVFSPNDDGVNDLFVPIKSEGIASVHTTIYNRWGSVVFETSNPLIEWDGENLADGVYFWVVDYIDVNGTEKSLHGDVTLFRSRLYFANIKNPFLKFFFTTRICSH